MPFANYPPPLDQLFTLGQVEYGVEWQGTDPDYVGKLGLTAEHVPALIEIARRWQEADDYPDEDAGWAPVHAWRALAQLRATEAVEPLLAMLTVLTETGDDFHLYDFPVVFGMIGPPAIPALAAYLHDAESPLFGRVTAGDGLRNAGLRYPAARGEALDALVEQLARFEENDYELNGFLVEQLTRLKAAEAAETIERAFASNRVAEDVCGHWGQIRQALGVTGMGLAPDGPPPRPQSEPRWGPYEPSTPADSRQQREQKKKEKARRKEQAKARKRNRKRK